MKAGTVINDPLVDLKGKRVGVQRSSTYDRFATQKLETAGVVVVRYSTQSEAFLDLVSGRLDATLADIIYTDESFIKTPLGQGYALVGPDINDPAFFGRGAGIAVRKGDTANAELAGGVVVLFAEIDGLEPVFGNRHGRQHRINLAHFERRNHAVELLDHPGAFDFHLLAQRVANVVVKTADLTFRGFHRKRRVGRFDTNTQRRVIGAGHKAESAQGQCT